MGLIFFVCFFDGVCPYTAASSYTYIQVVALNESVAGSVKSVFKPWEQRLDTSGVCSNVAVAMSLPTHVSSNRRSVGFH